MRMSLINSVQKFTIERSLKAQIHTMYVKFSKNCRHHIFTHQTRFELILRILFRDLFELVQLGNARNQNHYQISVKRIVDSPILFKNFFNS